MWVNDNVEWEDPGQRVRDDVIAFLTPQMKACGGGLLLQAVYTAFVEQAKNGLEFPRGREVMLTFALPSWWMIPGGYAFLPPAGTPRYAYIYLPWHLWQALIDTPEEALRVDTW